MRDPARIDRLLDLLRAYWLAHPDLRLGQIVGNFTPRVRKVSIANSGGTPVEYADSGIVDSYYVEDDVIEKELRRADATKERAMTDEQAEKLKQKLPLLMSQPGGEDGGRRCAFCGQSDSEWGGVLHDQDCLGLELTRALEDQ